MIADVPVFNKCCFYIPLRPGLLVWGYLRLLFTCLLVYCSVQLDIDSIEIYDDPDIPSYMVTVKYLVYVCIAVGALVADVVLNIVFIVGCHQKKVKPLKVFYGYVQVLLVLSVLTFVYIGVDNVYEIIEYDRIDADIETLLLLSLNLVIQVYVLMLVRSEIMKLDDGKTFQSKEAAIIAEYKLQIGAPPTYTFEK